MASQCFAEYNQYTNVMQLNMSEEMALIYMTCAEWNSQTFEEFFEDLAQRYGEYLAGEIIGRVEQVEANV